MLYDSVYQRLDYVDWFVNPAFASPEWRNYVVSLSGLSKMDMFGASTGARACWLVISDQIRANGVRAREILANLSAWLVATPSTLAQDWALAALQSPLAALRRPSPYMRERRDFMLRAADELAPLGIERTDFGGTFYAPLAFPGSSVSRSTACATACTKRPSCAIPSTPSSSCCRAAWAAFRSPRSRAARTARIATARGNGCRTARRTSRNLRCSWTAFAHASNTRAASAPRAALPEATRSANDEVWESTCTADGYGALDALESKAFAAARRAFLENPRHEDLRLTGTKHPDSTTHRAEQLERAMGAAPDDASERARVALTHIEWNPLMEARLEYEESIRDLLGPCSEVLLDLEGRQISPDWLDVPEKVVLALLRHGVVPGEDRHLLVRVPNPFLEQDEEKVSKILASVARSNLLFLLACERVGIVPKQNAIYEISVPQVNSTAEIGAVTKIGTMYLQAIDGLFEGNGDASTHSSPRASRRRAARSCRSKIARVRLVPLCENVGALAHLPDLLEQFYLALERGIGLDGVPTPADFLHRVRSGRGDRAGVRRHVRHRTAKWQARHRRGLHARDRGPRGRRATPRVARGAQRRSPRRR